jgi:hypothetical protein
MTFRVHDLMVDVVTHAKSVENCLPVTNTGDDKPDSPDSPKPKPTPPPPPKSATALSDGRRSAVLAELHRQLREALAA